MRIESISLKNFKGFRNAVMTDIPPFCVVIGANGSGNRLCLMCSDFCATVWKRRKPSLQARGGFNQVISRGAGKKDCIEFWNQIPYADCQQRTFGDLQYPNRLERNKPVIRREILKYKRGRYGSPYRFLDFSNGEGYAITNRRRLRQTRWRTG